MKHKWGSIRNWGLGQREEGMNNPYFRLLFWSWRQRRILSFSMTMTKDIQIYQRIVSPEKSMFEWPSKSPGLNLCGELKRVVHRRCTHFAVPLLFPFTGLSKNKVCYCKPLYFFHSLFSIVSQIKQIRVIHFKNDRIEIEKNMFFNH